MPLGRRSHYENANPDESERNDSPHSQNCRARIIGVAHVSIVLKDGLVNSSKLHGWSVTLAIMPAVRRELAGPSAAISVPSPPDEVGSKRRSLSRLPLPPRVTIGE